MELPTHDQLDKLFLKAGTEFSLDGVHCVYANLCEKFGHHLSTDLAIDMYVRQAERAYPHLAGE